MQAAIFDQFRGPLCISDVAAPIAHEDAVVIQVRACGICRSDWHAWMGHDDEVVLPHVPGHELAGVIAEVGSGVKRWLPGQRVTVPFCCGCGVCQQCCRGNPHICDSYTQPGFTQWGAFAEFVQIRHADVNLVELPASIDFITAASLGCRFATSFRALLHQAKLQGGEWVAVHGCGGVGLSAIMIAKSVGARVIAVDIRESRLQAARRAGAEETIHADHHDVVARIIQITDGGANVSLDALGSHVTCWNSIACLSKRGRHVQVGLMLGDQASPAIPMSTVIAKELELYGSHGMQAHEYSKMLGMISAGVLAPQTLVGDTVSLEAGAKLLTEFGNFPGDALTVIDFS